MNKIIEFIKSIQSDQTNSKSRLMSLIMPIVCLVFTVILVIFVIYPQTTSYLAVHQEIDDLHSKINDLNQKAQLLESVSVQNYQGQLDVATKALPIEKDFITSTSQIQTLAVQSHAQLTNISFGDAGTPEGYQIKIDVTG